MYAVIFRMTRLCVIYICSHVFHIDNRIYNYTYVAQKFGEGDGTPFQYSCLENPMDRGAWWASVHGVVKSRTRLSDFPMERKKALQCHFL